MKRNVSRNVLVASMLGAAALMSWTVSGRAANGKPRIVIVATGGTIAGSAESTTAAGYKSGAVAVDVLINAVPQMKKFKGKDKLFGDVAIRQDGRVIHPMYLFEVKKPDESKYPYDYYKLVSTIPADQAFRPIADGGCSLVK